MSNYIGNIVTDGAAAGYSYSFNGTGYSSIAGSQVGSNFTVGTGDFTVEAWAFPTVMSSTDNNVFKLYGSTNDIICIRFKGVNFETQFRSTSGTSTTTTGTINVVPNRWTHIAFTRSGTTTYMFVNGVLDQTITSQSQNLTETGSALTLTIGANQSGAAFFSGYISNLRFVKGYAAYTSTFTPPLQLSPITGTALLTCNQPVIADASTNAFAITSSNTVSTTNITTPFPKFELYKPQNGAATNGIFKLSDAYQATQTREWNAYDPFRNHVTLALSNYGANTANNHSFTDASTNNFAITRNGDATQGSFSPFSQSNWSSYSDGTAEVYTTNQLGRLGTSNFTVEGWFKLIAPIGGTNTNLWGEDNGSGTNPKVMLLLTSTNLIFHTGNIAGDVISVAHGGFPLNKWHHIAVVRNSTAANGCTIYLNGVALNATSTALGSLSTSTATFYMGYCGESYGDKFTGYISNFRITNTAVYSGLRFDVPTAPLTAISGTQLLTLQSNRYVDNGTANSGSGWTVTPSSYPSITKVSPFQPAVPYETSTIGGSAYFDGTTDYLTTATNSALALGTNTFCVEWWEYRTSNSPDKPAIQGGPGTVNYDPIFGYSNGTTAYLYLSSNNSSWDIASAVSMGTITLNSWNHFVVTRSGSTFRVFKNGIITNSLSSASSIYQSANQFTLGIAQLTSQAFTGYLSGVRVCVGSIPTNYQTASTNNGDVIFAVPSAPVTTTSQGSANTKLLFNFTNAGIYDNTGITNIQTLGDAQASTTQSKYGGSSLKFDGTGDYLSFPSNANGNFAFRTGDFTIEFWAWKSANGANNYDGVIAADNNGNATGGFAVELSSSRGFLFYNDSVVRIQSSTVNPNDSTWHHYAVVRASGVMALYKDGIQLTTAAYSGDLGATPTLRIGSISTTNNFNGYLDDLRVTKGVARYTANFIPATSVIQNM